MKIFLLSRYGRLGASSRVRFYQYIPYLEAHGVEITVSPLMGDDYLHQVYAGKGKPVADIVQAYVRRILDVVNRSRLSRYDFLWIEKELFPFLPGWGEALLKALDVPYVVDYDDAVFHVYDQHARGMVRTLFGKKIDGVMRRASLVIAGNDYLAQHARLAGAQRVECLPSVVDLDRYRHVPAQQSDVLTIGWIGSPYSARYLRLIESPLAEVCKGGRARLMLVGSGEVSLTGVPLEIRTWSEDTEIASIQAFDVGIMPLSDEPCERGKCGYKLIQCMACGRPVVASPVGVNRQIVDDGVSGFVASTGEEWVKALCRLRDDHGMRHAMGLAAREKVETHYSLQVNASRLLAMLRSVAGELR